MGRNRRIAGSVARAVRARVRAQEGEWWASPSDWTNYGDVNPKKHGGLFVRWEGNGWHLIETRKIGQDVPEDIGPPDATHVMFDHYFYPEDVFQGGDPMNGLTSAMKRILDSLGRENYDPDRYDDDLPFEYAPEFKENIGYYVVDLSHHIGDSRMDTTEDYWGYLEGRGIEREDFA